MILQHLYRNRFASPLLLRNATKSCEALFCLKLRLRSSSQPACCFCSSGAQDTTSQLSAAELHYTAKLARLSGLCYGRPERLAAKLQAEGLQVEAQGQTSFTRWCHACHQAYAPFASLAMLIAVHCYAAGGMLQLVHWISPSQCLHRSQKPR